MTAIRPTLQLTDDDVMEALRQVLSLIWEGSIPVVQGQGNKVSTPAVENYIVFTPMFRRRIATNRVTALGPTDAPVGQTTMQPTEITVQVDFHGEASPNNAQMVTTLFRDAWACAAFATVGVPVTPLYAGDARQTPFINGENQYENRWSVDVVLQANCAISTSLQFADTLAAGLIEVDAAYPPGG